MQPVFQQMQPVFQQMQPVFQQMQPVFQQMQPVHQQMQPVYQQMHPVNQQMHPVYHQQPAQYHQSAYTSAPVYRQLVKLVSSYTPQRQSYPTYPIQYSPGRAGRLIFPIPLPFTNPLNLLPDPLKHLNTADRDGRLILPFNFPYMNPLQPLQIDLNNEQANTIVNYVQSFTDPFLETADTFLGTDNADIGIDGEDE